MSETYHRAGKVPVDKFLSKVPIFSKRELRFKILNHEILLRLSTALSEGCKRASFCGKKVGLGSVRYRVYKAKGVTCVRCGIEGQFFAIERHKSQNCSKYHVNLYAIIESGLEIMMTVDHIIPKSKGGHKTVKNLQPMCSRCNSRKGNKDEREDREHYEKSVRS